jgi:hypothetical protein
MEDDDAKLIDWSRTSRRRQKNFCFLHLLITFFRVPDLPRERVSPTTQLDLVADLVAEADAADGEHNFAGNFSWPFRWPAVSASRTAFDLALRGDTTSTPQGTPHPARI